MSLDMYSDGFALGEEVTQMMIQSGINAKSIRNLIPVLPNGSKDSYMGFMMGMCGDNVYAAKNSSAQKKSPATFATHGLSTAEIEDIIARTYSERSR